MVLICEDLLNYVDGTIPCSAPIIPAALTNLDDITSWEQSDAKASSDLILNIGDHQVELVHCFPTSKDIWDNLNLTYKHSNIASQVSNHCHHVNHSLQEDKALPTFSKEWKCLLDEETIVGP